jgi:hypothetical protein
VTGRKTRALEIQRDTAFGSKVRPIERGGKRPGVARGNFGEGRKLKMNVLLLWVQQGKKNSRERETTKGFKSRRPNNSEENSVKNLGFEK